MVPGSTYPGQLIPTPNDPLGTRALTGERRLMTLYTRTGQLITNQVETFDATPIHRACPFLASPAGDQRGHTMKTRTAAGTPRSAGITLTEILISILILGVGLVSLATLFPIGLLRLREAQRQTRSAYLFQSATADVESRGLLSSNSFIAADLLNLPERVQPVVPALATARSMPNTTR